MPGASPQFDDVPGRPLQGIAELTGQHWPTAFRAAGRGALRGSPPTREGSGRLTCAGEAGRYRWVRRPRPVTDRLLGMIRRRGLTKHHVDVRAVDDLTFRMAPGEVTGVLGPGGAGRSTKRRSTLGLLRPTRCTALLNGERLSEPSR